MRYNRLLMLVLLTSVTCVVQAQIRYVSDELVITVRTGPSTQNAILRNLSSGDRVEILEENEDGSYARVRTDSGTEGWALTQYLQEGLTGDQRAAAAERDLATARARVDELEAQVAELSAALDQTRTEQIGRAHV